MSSFLASVHFMKSKRIVTRPLPFLKERHPTSQVNKHSLLQDLLSFPFFFQTNSSFLISSSTDSCNPDLRNIIQKCWNLVPKKRPSFSRLLRKFERLMNMMTPSELSEQGTTKRRLTLTPEEVESYKKEQLSKYQQQQKENEILLEVHAHQKRKQELNEMILQSRAVKNASII
jgi:hypothetical protein